MSTAPRGSVDFFLKIALKLSVEQRTDMLGFIIEKWFKHDNHNIREYTQNEILNSNILNTLKPVQLQRLATVISSLSKLRSSLLVPEAKAWYDNWCYVLLLNNESPHEFLSRGEDAEKKIVLICLLWNHIRHSNALMNMESSAAPDTPIIAELSEGYNSTFSVK